MLRTEVVQFVERQIHRVYPGVNVVFTLVSDSFSVILLIRDVTAEGRKLYPYAFELRIDEARPSGSSRVLAR